VNLSFGSFSERPLKGIRGSELVGSGFRGQTLKLPFLVNFSNLLRFFKKIPKFSLPYKKISKPLTRKIFGYDPD